MTAREIEISASILNADFARLGEDLGRAVHAGVDSVHLDIMDGHFVDNISFGPLVVEALRGESALPFHSHLMISRPLRFVEEFAAAGSDLIVFHVEAEDDPSAVIDRIHRTGRAAGIALNPETPATAVHTYLERVDLVLVMTVRPGFGGQAFMGEVLPKLSALRDEIERRGLDLPIGVDGGVNLETVGAAAAAGGRVMVVGSGIYAEAGDLRPVVDRLRAAGEASIAAAAASAGGS